jgi:hypothetical protein
MVRMMLEQVSYIEQRPHTAFCKKFAPSAAAKGGRKPAKDVPQHSDESEVPSDNSDVEDAEDYRKGKL